MVGLTSAPGLLTCAVAYPWLPPPFVCGSGPSEVAGTVEGFAAGLFPAPVQYMLFQALKPIIETRWRRPWLLCILLVGLVVLVGTQVMLHDVLGATSRVMIAVPSALGVIGMLGLLPIRGLLGSPAYFAWFRVLLCALIAFLVNFAAVWLIAGLPLGARIVIATAMLVLTVGGAILVLTTIWPSPCLNDAARFLLPGLLASDHPSASRLPLRHPPLRRYTRPS